MSHLPPENAARRDQIASELSGLARHAPDKLTARMAELSIQEQAAWALRLDAQSRLKLLLHAPKPMRLVRALPEADWYLTVREVGPEDALALIKLASTEQLLHLIDLEVWRGDRFDGDRAGAWIAVMLESGEPAIRRFLRHADEQVLALVLRTWLRVEPIEDEDSPDVHGHGLGDQGTEEGMTSPCGYYRFSPTIKELSAASLLFLRTFFVDQPERYQQTIWNSLYELPSELEEEALRWRQSRLEEHGFPTWEESLDAYAAPSKSPVRVAVPTPTDPDGLPASRRVLMPNWGPAPLVAAADCLDGSDLERFLHETVSLANRLLVADGADFGEPEHHRSALLKASAYVGIALETRGATDPESIANLFRAESVAELFREGWSRATALQRSAAQLVACGWGVEHPDPLRALDPPLDERVRALLEKRPRFVELAGQDLSGIKRDFASGSEIEETRVALEMADRVGNLVFGLLRWEPGPAEDPHRLSTLLLTTMARYAVQTDLTVGPLPAELLSTFLRTVAARRTAAPERPAGALDKLIRGLAETFDLSARDLSIIQGFGRYALERLADECGGLDPGIPPDRRFLNCLILEPIDDEG